MHCKKILSMLLLVCFSLALAAGELDESHENNQVNAKLIAEQSKVIIDAVASGSAEQAMTDLQAIGLESSSVFDKIISGILPRANLPAARQFGSINQIRINRTITASGKFTSEGDAALRSDSARQTFNVDGSGVKVGVISDSYNCLGGEEEDRRSDDLPQQVVVVEEAAFCEGLVDEGRAIMHLVHDIAPGAELLFFTGTNGYANTANGILKLVNEYDVDIIVDDAKSLTAPFFQKGAIVQAVEKAVREGVVFITAAGNSARLSYQSEYRDSYNPLFNLHAHDFDLGDNTDIFQRIELPEGKSISLIFQWDSPAYSVSGESGAITDLNIHLVDSGSEIVVAESIEGNLGKDPIEILEFFNPERSGNTAFDLMISKAAGPDPGMIKYILFNRFDGKLVEHPSNSGTIFGHANSESAITVGAGNYQETPAYGQDHPLLQYFSSAGGDTPWIFNSQGNRFVTQVTPRKPDVIAPDNINMQFALGEDTDGDGNPNFRGTSAAAPHVAGVAALMLQANTDLEPYAVKSILRMTAVDVLQRNDAGRTYVGNDYDFDSGFGLVDAHRSILLAVDYDNSSDDRNNNPPLDDIVVYESTAGSGNIDWSLLLALGVLLVADSKRRLKSLKKPGRVTPFFECATRFG